MGFFISTVIVIFIGLLLFFVVGQLVDALIFRIAVGPVDAVEMMERLLTPNRRRGFALNIVRPVVLTIVIFGGGLLTAAILGFGALGTVVSLAWFFLLTQFACLVGRRASLFEAGCAMAITILLLLGIFIVFQSAR